MGKSESTSFFKGNFQVISNRGAGVGGRRFSGPVGLTVAEVRLMRTDGTQSSYEAHLSLSEGCKMTGTILTCGEDSAPENWDRPQTTRGRNIVPMSATAISQLERSRYPICTFHGINPERPTPYMGLFLNKTVHGIKKDLFICTVPTCNISYELVKLGKKPVNILYTQEDVKAHELQNAKLDDPDDEDDEDDDVQILSSTPSPSTSKKPTPSSVANQSPRKRPSSTSPRFQPSITPQVPTQVGGFVPIFQEAVASARATFDPNEAMILLHCGKTGLYRRAPDSHPAFDVAKYTALDVYDISMHPDAVERSGGALWEYAYQSNAGSVIRALSSAVGIPQESIQILTDELMICAICKCAFTCRGYNRHIVGGKCGNWHTAMAAERVAVLENVPTQLKERTYPRGTTVEGNPSLQTAFQFQESRLGTALLAFNSRFGVPQDVWAAISTAYNVCDICYLARTFTAHRAHLDDKGECQDPGQEVAA